MIRICVWAMRAFSVSTPSTVKCALHGAPAGSEARSPGHVPTMSPNTPKSLPPIPSVTRSVSGVSASNCGAAVPSGVLCGCVMLVVSAPPQLTSVKWRTRSAAASIFG